MGHIAPVQCSHLVGNSRKSWVSKGRYYIRRCVLSIEGSALCPGPARCGLGWQLIQHGARISKRSVTLLSLTEGNGCGKTIISDVYVFCFFLGGREISVGRSSS